MDMQMILDIMQEYVEPEGEIGPDSSLKYDCGLTSFDLTCFTGDLCRKAGVDPDALDLRKLRTVGDLTDALDRAVKAKA